MPDATPRREKSRRLAESVSPAYQACDRISAKFNKFSLKSPYLSQPLLSQPRQKNHRPSSCHTPLSTLCTWNEYSLGVSRHCFSSRRHTPLVSVLPMRQRKVQRQIGFLGEQVEISGFPCVHVLVSVGMCLGSLLTQSLGSMDILMNNIAIVVSTCHVQDGNSLDCVELLFKSDIYTTSRNGT